MNAPVSGFESKLWETSCGRKRHGHKRTPLHRVGGPIKKKKHFAYPALMLRLDVAARTRVAKRVSFVRVEKLKRSLVAFLSCRTVRRASELGPATSHFLRTDGSSRWHRAQIHRSLTNHISNFLKVTACVLCHHSSATLYVSLYYCSPVVTLPF